MVLTPTSYDSKNRSDKSFAFWIYKDTLGKIYNDGEGIIIRCAKIWIVILSILAV